MVLPGPDQDFAMLSLLIPPPACGGTEGGTGDKSPYYKPQALL